MPAALGLSKTGPLGKRPAMLMRYFFAFRGGAINEGGGGGGGGRRLSTTSSARLRQHVVRQRPARGRVTRTFQALAARSTGRGIHAA